MLVARRVFFALLSSSFLAQDVLSSYVTRQPDQSLHDDDQHLVRRLLDPAKYKPLLDWQRNDPRYQSLVPPAAPEVKTLPTTNPVEVEQASPQPTEGKPQPMEIKTQPTNGKSQPTESKSQPTKEKTQALNKEPRPEKATRPVKVKNPRTKVRSQRLIKGPQPSKVPPQSTRIQQQLTKVPKTKSRMGKGKIGALSALVATGALLAGGGAAVGHKEGLFRREDGPVPDYVEQEITSPLLHSYGTGALTKE